VSGVFGPSRLEVRTSGARGAGVNHFVGAGWWASGGFLVFSDPAERWTRTLGNRGAARTPVSGAKMRRARGKRVSGVFGTSPFGGAHTAGPWVGADALFAFGQVPWAKRHRPGASGEAALEKNRFKMDQGGPRRLVWGAIERGLCSGARNRAPEATRLRRGGPRKNRFEPDTEDRAGWFGARSS